MGLTVLDAGPVIGALDSRDVFHVAAATLLRHLRDHRETVVVPAVSYAEALVRPMFRGDDAVARVDTLIAGLSATVSPVDSMVARRAARLRADALGDRRRRQWRMPDALVAATALVLDADRVVTADSDWPTVSGLTVEVLTS